MQFLAAGHKIRIGFLWHAEQIQMKSDKFTKNLEQTKEIQVFLEENQIFLEEFRGI